jgi:hypothetical protein
MYDLSAEAYQTRSGIYVTVRGMLADSCARARITGTYPGNIIHIRDPGHAEVFIAEWKESIGFCTDALIPWEESVLIRDFEHKQVAILVNDKQELLIDVIGWASLQDVVGPNDWIVTALVVPEKPPYAGCSIRDKDAIYPRIYRRVFGPDTRAKCEQFIKKNCAGKG